jgi:predicted CoA-binding protein
MLFEKQKILKKTEHYFVYTIHMQNNKKTKITLVGVSADPQKYGHKIFKDLLASNYNVIGLNPKGEKILDHNIFKSLKEIDRDTELLILVVPPKIGTEVVKKAHELKIKNIWLQPGAQNDEIIAYAAANQINLTYNQCFMVDQGIW